MRIVVNRFFQRSFRFVVDPFMYMYTHTYTHIANVIYHSIDRDTQLTIHEKGEIEWKTASGHMHVFWQTFNTVSC